MSAPRLPDWEARFVTFLESLDEPEYVYGARDCALLSADNVLALTDFDPAAEFRGAYTTAAGSAKALKRFGAGTLEATIDGRFDAIAPARAQRGDLAFHDGAVGVVLGPVALFLGEAGGKSAWLRVPRAEWVKAWRV